MAARSALATASAVSVSLDHATSGGPSAISTGASWATGGAGSGSTSVASSTAGATVGNSGSGVGGTGASLTLDPGLDTECSRRRGHDRRHDALGRPGILALLADGRESGRDDGDLQVVAEGLVVAETEEDMGIVARRGLDQDMAPFRSARVTSPAVRYTRTAREPAMSTFSSNGELMAVRAASAARSSPKARPVPMMAAPLFCMTVRTSAKSRLIPRRGCVIRSEMPARPVAARRRPRQRPR